jgi:hypothetical protein
MLILANVTVQLESYGTPGKIAYIMYTSGSIRSIWSNPNTTDAEKIEAIKIVNELSHRIFNWIWELRMTERELLDVNCFADIRGYGQQNSIAAGEIGAALNHTRSALK